MDIEKIKKILEEKRTKRAGWREQKKKEIYEGQSFLFLKKRINRIEEKETYIGKNRMDMKDWKI